MHYTFIKLKWGSLFFIFFLFEHFVRQFIKKQFDGRKVKIDYNQSSYVGLIQEE